MAYETASCGGGNGCEAIMDWDDGKQGYGFLAMDGSFREAELRLSNRCLSCCRMPSLLTTYDSRLDTSSSSI